MHNLGRSQIIFLIVVLILGSVLCSSYVVYAIQVDLSETVEEEKKITEEIHPKVKRTTKEYFVQTTEKSELDTTEPTTQPEITKPKKAKNKIKKKSEKTEEYGDYTWNGPKLTLPIGEIQGPSGKETYYNLNMSGCISIMKDIKENPDSDKYIRVLSEEAKQKIVKNLESLTSFEETTDENKVKRIGQYVMCAADLRIRPKGTILKTSFGWGMVVDTGTFANTDDPTNQLDIAVNW